MFLYRYCWCYGWRAQGGRNVAGAEPLPDPCVSLQRPTTDRENGTLATNTRGNPLKNSEAQRNEIKKQPEAAATTGTSLINMCENAESAAFENEVK